MRLSWCIFFFTSTNKRMSYYFIPVRKLYGFYPERLFKENSSTIICIELLIETIECRNSNNTDWFFCF